jgi:hypothetical protein
LSKAKSGERHYLCEFEGTTVFRNDLVAVSRPISYADEPPVVGRVCSLVGDDAMPWEHKEIGVLVCTFTGAYIMIKPGGLQANFGLDLRDGYDACFNAEERKGFALWKGGKFDG